MDFSIIAIIGLAGIGLTLVVQKQSSKIPILNEKEDPNPIKFSTDVQPMPKVGLQRQSKQVIRINHANPLKEEKFIQFRTFNKIF